MNQVPSRYPPFSCEMSRVRLPCRQRDAICQRADMSRSRLSSVPCCSKGVPELVRCANRIRLRVAGGVVCDGIRPTQAVSYTTGPDPTLRMRLAFASGPCPPEPGSRIEQCLIGGRLTRVSVYGQLEFSPQRVRTR